MKIHFLTSEILKQRIYTWKAICISLFLILSSLSIQGQPSYLDSLHIQLAKTSSPIDSISILHKMSSHVFYSDLQLANQYINQTQQLIDQTQNKEYYFKNGLKILDILIQQGHLDSALAIGQRYLINAKEVKNLREQLEFTNSIGAIYERLLEDEKAIEMFEEGLHHTPDDDEYMVMKVLFNNNIGVILTKQDKTGEAVPFHQEALKYSEELQSPRFLCESMTFLAAVYLSEHDFNSAIKYAKRAIAIAEKHDVKSAMMQPFHSLIESYRQLDSLSIAETTAFKSIQHCKRNWFG